MCRKVQQNVINIVTFTFLLLCYSFKTESKIRHLFNPKDSLNDEEKSLIYQIPCESCDVKSIGQTKGKTTNI